MPYGVILLIASIVLAVRYAFLTQASDSAVSGSLDFAKRFSSIYLAWLPCFLQTKT